MHESNLAKSHEKYNNADGPGWNICAGQFTGHDLINRIGWDEVYRLTRTGNTTLLVGQL
jgi:hypothetical protein